MIDILKKILALSSLAAFASIRNFEILAALIDIDKRDEVKQAIKTLNDEYNEIFKHE